MNQKFTTIQMRQRCLDLVREIALGKSNAQIEQSLGWKKNDVTNTRKRLYKLTGLQDSREVTIYALALGIVTQQELEKTILIIPF